ncbi:MAG: sigma 54 modulation/S30EA ribosomal C-terminal domain-containing protein, partial [Rhizobiales bacterium]|nr:sigma 54 modulation/S30EA ribosomal C-terminal domain-containing protein [Hyphomicrobiales bacterium]
RRYKRRLRDHHAQRSEPAARFDAPDYTIRSSDEEEEPEPEGLNPVIVAESKISIQELAVGEAVMQMDISEKPFLVFRNGSHGRINVVYRRDDGNIGWIDPDLVENKKP